ncbi:MAG: 50S ribosome-binding GTPase [Spirochaetales bacterium]|nr:50S ribosome-binding GTPase [Spirochaetales bacterium]
MPTNVTPEYRKAEEAFRKAATIDEKVACLEDMIALLPKHKGTDHLFADLRRKLSKLKGQMESSGKKGGGPGLGFAREGAAQVILAGPPSCGKSSILAALTNASPEIGDYPFTTTHMLPGMAAYEDIQIQLVDSPPVTPDCMPVHLLGLVRSADALLLVADLSADSLLEDLEAVAAALRARHVRLVPEKDPKEESQVRCRIAANKLDAPGAQARLELLKELLAEQAASAAAAPSGPAETGLTAGALDGGLEVVPICAHDPASVGVLPRMLFEWLQIVRVYTKAPGDKPDLSRPYTVFAGQSVADICRLIHKDFAESLRFARLWRSSEHPITVSPHEPVQDRDILELHL